MEPRGDELEQERWQPFFEELNRRLEQGAQLEVTIEIVGDEAGGPEVERLPLDSITHERGDDQIAIGVGGRGRRFPAALWHFVDKPRHLYVERSDGDVRAMTIVSADGTHTLVTLYPEERAPA
jgi:hypothetical protein